jgi:hypothetical protein
LIGETISLIPGVRVFNPTTRQKGILHKFRGGNELERNFY